MGRLHNHLHIKHAPVPAKLYSNEGLAQLIFLGASEMCETSYADKAEVSGTEGDNSFKNVRIW